MTTRSEARAFVVEQKKNLNLKYEKGIRGFRLKDETTYDAIRNK